jgi:hypothetical protein
MAWSAPRASYWCIVAARSLSKWPSRTRPVEAGPDGPAVVIAFDTPVVGQRAHDVESVAALVIGDRRSPGPAFVFDFEPEVITGTDFAADGERAARQLGLAVQEFR